MRLIGSVRVALVLLGCAIVFVAVGTLIESHTDSHMAAARIAYRHPIFLAILGGFFANILCAALSRWPFRRKHVPFLVAHLGLLMVLAGAIIKPLFGIQGVMTLVEGSASDLLIFPNTHAIEVRRADGQGWNVPLAAKAAGELQITCLDLMPHGEGRFDGWTKGNCAIIEGLRPLPLDGSQVERVAMPDGTPWILEACHYADVEARCDRFPKLLFARDAEGIDHLIEVRGEADRRETCCDPAALEAIICRNRGFGGYALWHAIEGARLTTPLSLQLRALPPLPRREDCRPLATLRLSESDRRETVRLLYDPNCSSLLWPALGGHYALRFQPKTERLPWRLRLHDARRIDYPHSNQPYSYECDLTLTGPNGKAVETTISMNRVFETPDGFRFYLSGISSDVEQAPARVTLAVSRDPAKRFLTYPGGAIVAVGILLLFRRKRYH